MLRGGAVKTESDDQILNKAYFDTAMQWLARGARELLQGWLEGVRELYKPCPCSVAVSRICPFGLFMARLARSLHDSATVAVWNIVVFENQALYISCIILNH